MKKKNTHTQRDTKNNYKTKKRDKKQENNANDICMTTPPAVVDQLKRGQLDLDSVYKQNTQPPPAVYPLSLTSQKQQTVILLAHHPNPPLKSERRPAPGTSRLLPPPPSLARLSNGLPTIVVLDLGGCRLSRWSRPC